MTIHLKNLEELTTWQRACYGAALVTRMRPNFQLFCEVSDQPSNSQVYSDILSLVWEYASGQNKQVNFERQQEKLEAIVPEQSTFEGYGIWPALDATAGLSSLLSLCHKDEIQELDSMIKLSSSTIAQYLEFSGVEESEQDNHELVAAESDFNDFVLSALNVKNEGERKDAVLELKKVLWGHSSSNIGIELE